MRLSSLLLILSIGCGGGAGVNLSPADSPVPDCILSSGAQVVTPDPSRCPTLDLAISIFVEISAGDGYPISDHTFSTLVITVVDSPIGCGGLGTLGCTKKSGIEISSWEVPPTSWLFYGEDHCYELILSHELIHWSMKILSLDPDGAHENPVLFEDPDSLAQRVWEEIEMVVCPLSLL